MQVRDISVPRWVKIMTRTTCRFINGAYNGENEFQPRPQIEILYLLGFFF